MYKQYSQFLLLIVALLTGICDVNGQEPVSRISAWQKTQEANMRGEYRHALEKESWRGDDNAAWGIYARMARANASIYEGLLRSAEQELETIGETFPTGEHTAYAWLKRGEIELKRKNYGVARLHLNQAIQDAQHVQDCGGNEISGVALYWIGISQAIEFGAAEGQGLKALTECVEKYPYNSRADDALFAIGQLAEARGDYQAATRYYQTLLEKYQYSDFRIVSAIRETQCLLLTRNYPDALAQAELCQEEWEMMNVKQVNEQQKYAAETEIELLLLTGDARLGMKDYPTAEQAYLRVVYEYGGSYQREAMLGLADTYLATGHTDSALAIYNRVVAGGRGDWPGMKADYYTAIALLGTGDTLNALAEFHRINADHAHIMNSIAGLKLAEMEYTAGDYSGAATYSSKVLGAASEDRVRARANLLLGSALFADDESDRAADAFLEAERIAAAADELVVPEKEHITETARRMAGLALGRSGRSAEAVSKLNRFIESYPNSAQADEVTYWLGEAYYDVRLYPMAAQTMETLIERYPMSGYTQGALYTLGWAHFRRKEFDSAEHAFARLVKAYPISRYTAEAQIRRGDCYYLTGKYTEAAAAYKNVQKMNPEREEALYAGYQSAMAEYQQGAQEEAHKDFGLFVKENPSSENADDALFMLGLIDFRRGSYAEAIAQMNGLIESYPNSLLHARAYYTIGDAYYKQDKYGAAYAAYSIVLDRFPTSTYIRDARTGMTHAQTALERERQQNNTSLVMVAQNDSNRAVDEARLHRAEIFTSANQIELSLEEYRAYVARNSGRTAAVSGMMGLAEGYLKMGDTATAMDTLRVAVQEFPESSLAPVMMLRMAELHINGADTAQALNAFAHVRTQYPQSAGAEQALLSEAKLYIQLGRDADAINLLKEGVWGLDSTSGYRTRNGAQLLGMLAILEESTGQADSAIARLNTLAQRDDSVGAEALYQIATIQNGKGLYGDAAVTCRAIIERFAETGAWKSRAELELGTVYEKTMQAEKAQELYRALAERHTDDDIGVEARTRLKRLQRL